MNLLTCLKLEERRLERLHEQLTERLRNTPEGRIRINRNGPHIKWRRVFDEKPERRSEPISKKEISFAAQLASKELLLGELDDLEAKITCIRSCINSYPGGDSRRTVFQDAEIRRLAAFSGIEGMTGNSELNREWSSAAFECSNEHPENKVIPTKARIMVRSKSEAMIANALTDAQLPFRYEQALMISGIRTYPDFTVLCPDGSGNVIYWEHFGMMDVPAYAQMMRAKLSAYMEAGILPGKDLIMTFESKNNVPDLLYIEMLISYYFC